MSFHFLQALHLWSFWLHLSKHLFRDVHNLSGTTRRHKKYDKTTAVSFRKSHRRSRWSKNLMNTFHLTSVSKNYLSTNMSCTVSDAVMFILRNFYLLYWKHLRMGLRSIPFMLFLNFRLQNTFLFSCICQFQCLCSHK